MIAGKWAGARSFRLGAIVILLAAFALRVHQLGVQELRGDEAFGYFFAQRSYSGIIDATLALQEPHPVASYFVMKAWLGASGDSEFALRFPSAWFGVLAVALLLRLGLRLGFQRGAALLAMTMMAISPYVIWHAQDARMYSMSLTLTTAAVWLGVETLQRQRVRWGLAYVAAAWLALHTHYYAVFVLVALNFFVLTRAIFVSRTRANLATWILWQLLVGALYLPWLASAASILGGYGGNGDSPTFIAMIQRATSVFAVGESATPQERSLWAGVAGVLLLIGGMRLLFGSAADRRNLWLLVCYLGIPVLATWWGAQSRPIFNERYLVAGAPAFYLLLSAAFDGRRFGGRREKALRWLSLLLLGALILGMALSLQRAYDDPAYSKTRGWRALAIALDHLSAGLPADEVRIAQNFPDPTLWYYYRGPVEHLVLPPTANDAAGAASTVGALAEEGVHRVLLPVQPAPNWDDQHIAADALVRGAYVEVLTQQVGVWPLQVYARTPITALAPLAVGFANGVRLVGFGGIDSTTAVSPGALLTPGLTWSLPAGIGTNAAVKVTVQLLDPAGHLAAQQDLPLVAGPPVASGERVHTYGLLLPEELAPGAYRLIAGLYDSAAEGAPRIQTTTGEDAVELARIQVEK